MGDEGGAPERGGKLRAGDGVGGEGGVSERGRRRAGAGGGVGDDEGVSERGGGVGECAESPPEPLRHLKHLADMLLSSQASAFFRHYSCSPGSRNMISSTPQFR